MKATVEIIVSNGLALLPAGTIFGVRGQGRLFLFQSETEISTMFGGPAHATLTATKAGCDHNLEADLDWWVDELGPIVNGVCNVGEVDITNPEPACGGVDPE